MALASIKHAVSLGMAHAEGQYNVAVIKATNLDIVPPKEKHVRYLISWTNDYPTEENLVAVFKSVAARLEEKDAIITLKTLATLHRILREGPTGFTEVALARAAALRLDQLKKVHEVELAGQLHQAGTPTLVAFIRRYAFYLQDRLYTWRSLGFDFLRQKPKRADERDVREIIKRAQTLQRLLSSLYECESENLRGIPPKLAGVALLMKDAFRLYRLINEAVLEILEDYFSLDKESALEALQVYRRFDEQTNQQIKLYKLGRELPGGYQLEDLPQLKKLSDQVIPTLEDYIKQLEEGGEDEEAPRKPSGSKSGKKKKDKKPAAVESDDDMIDFSPATRNSAKSSSPALMPQEDPTPNLMSEPADDLDDLLGNLDFNAPPPAAAPPANNPFSANTTSMLQQQGQQGSNPFAQARPQGMMQQQPQQGGMGGMMQPQGGMMRPQGGMMQQQPQQGGMGGMMQPQQGGMMRPQGGMMQQQPQQGGMGGMMQPQGGMMRPQGGMMQQQPQQGGMGGMMQPQQGGMTVSYTHLTLPTKRIV
eukprot:TRINITY_DN725_c0_g1_i3.p1 TRINITY_DN725_c0_g1~~TRINITY_DN725_c0_g1_i3.p1  ORF type:complete len:535 (-),score=125.15 TRINITY_DN725_c0_g1_i3:142-1746(-)